MPSTLGTPTVSTFLLEVNSHNVHLEFVVKTGVTIKKGMPVELHTNGEVQIVTPSTYETTCIGIALQDRAAGEKVTVATFGHCVIAGEAKTAMNAGPVLYDTYNGTTAKLSYDDTSVTAANQAGWSLDAATTALDEIRVLVRH